MKNSPSILGFDASLGRKVRIDPPASLKEGTYRKIREALANGKAAQARDLVDFSVLESRVIYDLYSQWRRDIERYLYSKLPLAVVQNELKRIRELTACYHPGVRERDTTWSSLLAAAETAKTECDASNTSDPSGPVRDLWRALHDSDVDFLSGLMDVVVRILGESALGEMYEEVLGDWFRARYQRFDVSKASWEQVFSLIVYLTFESMHGHLCGPERDGSMSYEEFDDRVTFTFAPCGSGGRTVLGEQRDGLPPLMDSPFRYRVMQEEHDFAWNKKGVCTYCVHCCVLTEKMPMEKFGYPARVVDPPVYPNDGNAVCRWTVYRRPEDVPAAVYERVGLVKPQPGSELGSDAYSKRHAVE